MHVSYSAVNDPLSDPSNIGVALATCTMAILDVESNQILDEGAVGELCIAGHQIADGYLHRDDLNAKAFQKHPKFSGRLYRTGDLAHMLNDKFYFDGRIQGDSQVKIHGQRIELGEIATAIEAYKEVLACTAMMVSDALFAFVVLHSSDQIKASLGFIRQLPFDVRPRYVILKEMPTSASGKRDYRHLRTIAEDKLQLDRVSSGEETGPLSDRALSVLSAVRSVISTHILPDQAFDLYGIDSLTAIKVVMSLRNEGWSTSVYDVLDSNSVKKLSDRLRVERQLPKQPAALSSEIALELVEKYGKSCQFALCSAIQESMLAATFAAVDHDLYMNHVLLEIDSDKTEHEVLSAWNILCNSHEILRTGFHVATQAAIHDFIQIIYPRATTDMESEHVDDGDLNSAIQEHKLSHFFANISSSAIGVRHFRTSASSFLSIKIHHALYDAWSLELMVNDLDTILQGYRLPEKTQYRELASEYNDETRLTESKKLYWSAHLNNVAAPACPALTHMSGKDDDKWRAAKLCSVSLDHLDRSCIERQTSPQVLGQLVWALILSWVTGETNVCMALTTSGRTIPVANIENTLGPFLSTFPFSFDTSKSPTIAEAFRTIGAYNRKLTKYNMSYRDILKCCDPSGRPDSLFIYQKTGAEVHQTRCVKVVEQQDRLEFAVMLSFDRRPEGLFLALDATKSLISQDAANTLLGLVDSLVSNLLSIPLDQDLDQLKVLPARLSSEIITGNAHFPESRLDEIISMQCRRDPGAPALQFFDTLEHCQTLSYAQLDRAAQKLASSLVDEPLLPGEIIAICLDKSVAMYASILATLKLGCAYLALEPTLPDARIEVILNVTKARHVFADCGTKNRFGNLKVIDAGLVLENAEQPSFASRPSDGLAYVLMTSGTTGKPKACLVSHANVMTNCSALSNIYPHSPKDRMMQFTSCTPSESTLVRQS